VFRRDIKLLTGFALALLFVCTTIGINALWPQDAKPDPTTVAQLVPTEIPKATELPFTQEPTATETSLPTDAPPTSEPSVTEAPNPTLLPTDLQTDTPLQTPTAEAPQVLQRGDLQFTLEGSVGAYSAMLLTGGGNVGGAMTLEVWLLNNIQEQPVMEVEPSPYLSLDGSSWNVPMIVRDAAVVRAQDGITAYALPPIYLSPNLTPGTTFTVRVWVSGLPERPADELTYTFTVVGNGGAPIQPTAAPAA
jgi:hypothetical protein